MHNSKILNFFNYYKIWSFVCLWKNSRKEIYFFYIFYNFYYLCKQYFFDFQPIILCVNFNYNIFNCLKFSKTNSYWNIPMKNEKKYLFNYYLTFFNVFRISEALRKKTAISFEIFKYGLVFVTWIEGNKKNTFNYSKNWETHISKFDHSKLNL